MFWTKQCQSFPKINLLLIIPCMQFWFVISRYLNSATFSKDLLPVFTLKYCPAFHLQDTNIYLVIQAFIHRSITLFLLFKKRLNFSNSMPTSKDSTLPLLSTLSIRFWQQIAICPVSLWGLVVKLHLLNWACTQAVRRISDNERAWRTTCVTQILLQTW